MDCINKPSSNLGLLNLLPNPSSSVEVCWTMKLCCKSVVFSCSIMPATCEFKCKYIHMSFRSYFALNCPSINGISSSTQ